MSYFSPSLYLFVFIISLSYFLNIYVKICNVHVQQICLYFVCDNVNGCSMNRTIARYRSEVGLPQSINQHSRPMEVSYIAFLKLATRTIFLDEWADFISSQTMNSWTHLQRGSKKLNLYINHGNLPASKLIQGDFRTEYEKPHKWHK